MADYNIIGYEGGEDPATIQIGKNPAHKQLMAWTVNDEIGSHEIHYHHGSMGFGTSAHNFAMHEGDAFVGTMGLDKDGVVQHIEIHPEKRRQGLATKLFKFGHELHEEINTIPAPQHSDTRTPAGEAWATKMGGDRAEIVIDPRDYRHHRWGLLRETAVPKLKQHLNEFHAKMISTGLDSKATGDALFHVTSAHEYLTRAHEVGKKDPNYFDHMNNADKHIEELGYIHEAHGGNMDDHLELQDHIGRLYG